MEYIIHHGLNDSLLIICLTILSHGCALRHFDRLLLVFITQGYRLAVSHYKQHVAVGGGLKYTDPHPHDNIVREMISKLSEGNLLGKQGSS